MTFSIPVTTPSRPATTCLAAILLAASTLSHAGTRLSIGPRQGTPGEALSTPIEISSNEGLVALQMDLSFDSGTVAIDAIEPSAFATDHTLKSGEVDIGQHRLLVYSPTNAILPNGVIADAQLNLLSGYAAGANAFSVSQLRFVTETGAALDVSLAPYIRLSAPAAGATFNELAQSDLSAIAVATAGDVTRVEFLLDGRVVATDTSAPYSAAWLADGSGQALLSAIAYDSDGDFSESPATQVTVTPAPFLADWRAERFDAAQREDSSVSGFSADPDGDGIMNLLEFAFGLEPLNSDRSGLPEATLEADDDGSRYLTIEFAKPADLDTLDYTIEVSEDLLQWQSAPDAVSRESLGTEDGMERFRGRAVAPVAEGDEDAMFIRVRVEPAL